MKLTEYLEILAYDIAFWLTGFTNRDYPLAQLGELSMDVTQKLRAAAIIILLTKSDSDAFFHNLIRSAKCRVAYLTRLNQAGANDDHHQASGRIEPFLDAVAASDFATARQIIALSPTEWMQGHEYEDDFCYAQILHHLITVPRNDADLRNLLTRYESALSGRSDARFDLCKVIIENGKEEFEQAFEDLLAQRTAQIESNKTRRQMEDPVVIAERQIYIEGLAILQIAGRLGFASESEYLYCPSIARVAMKKPFPGE